MEVGSLQHTGPEFVILKRPFILQSRVPQKLLGRGTLPFRLRVYDNCLEATHQAFKPQPFSFGYDAGSLFLQIPIVISKILQQIDFSLRFDFFLSSLSSRSLILRL